MSACCSPSGEGLPGMVGKPIAALVFGTSVPSAMLGYLLAGIGVFFVTHAASPFRSAARIGPTGAGFDDSAHDGTGFVDTAKPPGPPPCDTPAK